MPAFHGLTPVAIAVSPLRGCAGCLRVQKEFPELVEKQGVLVVRSEAVGDLAEAIRGDRDRRISNSQNNTSVRVLLENSLLVENEPHELRTVSFRTSMKSGVWELAEK